MDWLQFFAAVIGHLAWPVVILILLIMVRKQIHSLAERLLEFSFGGAKVTFDKILQKGAEIIEEAPLPALPKPSEQPELKLERPPSNDDKRELIANNYARRRRQKKIALDQSPFGRVLLGLEEVDNLLYEIGDELGTDVADPASVLYALIAQQRFPENVGKLYQTLKDARVVASHSPNLPDDKEAREYDRQATYLKNFLEGFKQRLYEESFTKVEEKK